MPEFTIHRSGENQLRREQKRLLALVLTSLGLGDIAKGQSKGSQGDPPARAGGQVLSANGALVVL
jgi:hypothetical protein